MKKNQDAERNNLALYLFHEGTNYKTYEYLGSHKLEQDGKEGVVFRTWAPNAAKISVVGEFNGWDEKKDPMERISEGSVLSRTRSRNTTFTAMLLPRRMAKC